jgi:hypothetical protein
MAGESPMKRTYCDVDGQECVNKTVNIHVHVEHHTKDYKTVGEDYYKSIEVCTDCENLLRRLMPQAFTMDHTHSEEPQIAETPLAYENAREMPSREYIEEAIERRHRDSREAQP